MQKSKEKVSLIGSSLLSALFAIYGFIYIYDHYEYLDENLLEILIMGILILTVLQVVLFLWICKVRKRIYEKKLFRTVLCCYAFIFTILFLVKLYRYSASFYVVFTFGIQCVLLFLCPATIISLLVHRIYLKKIAQVNDFSFSSYE